MTCNDSLNLWEWDKILSASIRVIHWVMISVMNAGNKIKMKFVLKSAPVNIVILSTRLRRIS